MKYQVGVKIYHNFEIEATSKDKAEQKARELDFYKNLVDWDFEICYVEETKEVEHAEKKRHR